MIGNRKTAARSDELLVALHLPATALTGPGAFVKLGARRYLVISIVMVAGTLDLADDGTIATARIAIGACSSAALRMTAGVAEAGTLCRRLGQRCNASSPRFRGWSATGRAGEACCSCGTCGGTTGLRLECCKRSEWPTPVGGRTETSPAAMP